MAATSSATASVLRPIQLQSSYPPPTSGRQSVYTFSPYDAVPMTLDDCVERVKLAIKPIQLWVSNKNVKLEKVICPISLNTPVQAVVTNCGHTYDRIHLERRMAEQPGFRCVELKCQTPISLVTPNHAIQSLIDGWRKEDTIPILSEFKEENQELFNQYLVIARHWAGKEKYSEAIELYRKAFLHTNSSKYYEEVPPLYEKNREPHKAILTYLHLTLRQLRLGDVEGALGNLFQCRRISGWTLDMSLLRAGLSLLKPESASMSNLLAIVTLEKDPDEKISIYKQILVHHPRDARLIYELCVYLKNPSEKIYYLLKCADIAKEKGETWWETKWRDEAGLIQNNESALITDFLKSSLVL